MRATPWRLRLNRLNLALSSDDVIAIRVQCRIHSCIIRGKGVVCPNSDPIFVLKLVFSKLGKLELILCMVPIFQSLDSTVAEITKYRGPKLLTFFRNPRWRPPPCWIFRLYEFGYSGVLTVWYLCSVPNWVKIYALVTEIDALMLQTFI